MKLCLIWWNNFCVMPHSVVLSLRCRDLHLEMPRLVGLSWRANLHPRLVHKKLLVLLRGLNKNDGEKPHRSRLQADFTHLQRLMSSALVCFVLGFGNSRWIKGVYLSALNTVWQALVWLMGFNTVESLNLATLIKRSVFCGISFHCCPGGEEHAGWPYSG